MAIVAITTMDNPYDPITNFFEWFNYDNQKGYGTCQYLARMARTSDQLSDNENEEEIERVINKMVTNGFAVDKNGNISNYKKVVIK